MYIRWISCRYYDRFIQSIVMTIALVVVVVYGVNVAGGFDMVMENSKALPGYLGF